MTERKQKQTYVHKNVSSEGKRKNKKKTLPTKSESRSQPNQTDASALSTLEENVHNSGRTVQILGIYVDFLMRYDPNL